MTEPRPRISVHAGAASAPKALAVDDVEDRMADDKQHNKSMASTMSAARSFMTSAYTKAASSLTVPKQMSMNREDNSADVEIPAIRRSSIAYNCGEDPGEDTVYDFPALAASSKNAEAAYMLLELVANRNYRELRQAASTRYSPETLAEEIKVDLTAWREEQKKREHSPATCDVVNCLVRCCRCCCCCCSCLCAPPSLSTSSAAAEEADTSAGFLRGFRRNGEGKLVEEYFDPNGHTLLGCAVRMHSFEAVYILLTMAKASYFSKSTTNHRELEKFRGDFLDKKDKKLNTAAFYASKIYNWENENDPSNRFLKLLVSDCGAEFVVQELAHFTWTNDFVFIVAGVIVVIGYVICLNWKKVMEATVAKVTAVNSDCDTLYGIALKPIFLTFLDAATMRILQYFTANPRWIWVCKPAQYALDLVRGGGIPTDANGLIDATKDKFTEKVADAHGKVADVQDHLSAGLQAVQSPVFSASGGASGGASSLQDHVKTAISQELEKDGGEVFEDLQGKYEEMQEMRDQASAMRESIADPYEEDGVKLDDQLPNPPVTDDKLTGEEKREHRAETLKKYVQDASSYDDVSGRMGTAMKYNPKMIFIYLQCAKFVFSTIFAMGKAAPGSSPFKSYVNWYGLVMNADLPTVIFSMLSPIHMDLEVLRELDDNKGLWGLLVTIWHILLYFWHRFCDIFSFKKFGYWTYLMRFPFIILIPPFFTHFCVAGTLYFWLGFVCLFFFLIGWRFKWIFFCILRCFEQCFDVWFLLWIVFEVVARFGFVVYCQTLYNVMSVIYLQDNVTDPKNYIFALTWTWHLTMNPQCFAENKDVAMLLIYLSAF